MVNYRSAAAALAMMASANVCTQAFTSNKVSTTLQSSARKTSAQIAKPFGMSIDNSRTSLQMGVMEDFLAGTDNEKRKVENEKYVATLGQRVEKINALEATIEDLGDDEILAKTQELRQRLKNGEDINGAILEEAFAVVRETAW
jgi:hypothetical protein